MKINWGACIASAFIYVFSMIVIGDLLINSMGEQVGPVTDMVITSLALLVIVYVAARKSEKGKARLWGGVLAGGLCFLAQLILSTLTLGISLIPLLIQIVLFFGLAFAGGFAAQRL